MCIRGWSNRGDMRLFLGNFQGAKSGYEQKMIRLDPLLEVSHWRPGITYFYLQEYDKAARQFEICHNYDEVDRENGIWHFMSQYKREGLKAVRDGLLIYEKDIVHPIHCFIKCLQVARLHYFQLLSRQEVASSPKRL